ncbi:MAG: DUF58 domain-containing protein [Methanofollis sp.]|uniref:DUF58 domain-containing protein n=1 Tax=Methanofollis sp. TaxID=2052835 RepID=UPI00261FBBE0|nr:DUF58 domain-containing protein [Methanofollis sp.]MDD4254158.1 DUF58 domain-containing protein [Methanofollis sp.]
MACDVAALIRGVRPVPLQALLPVGGMQAGGHRSSLTGQGVEFAGIRAYVPGDDVRTIDWKVTARRNAPYVREYAEDRETTLYITVDVSASAGFCGTAGKEKAVIEAAAALALGAGKNGDRLGLCLFSDRVETFIPARRGKRHLAAVLSALLDRRPFSGRTDLAAPLRFIAATVPRHSTVAVVSDFFGDPFFDDLAILRRRHEAVLVRVVDAAEEMLPDVGLISLEDPETGEQVIADTSDPAFRARYGEAAEEEARALGTGAGTCRTPLLPLRAGDDLIDAVPGRRR